MLSITTKSADETVSMGKELAHFLKAGDVLALTGELGSGKTTFTKGIAQGLGVCHPEYVNSPSFVLIKKHKAKIALYHLDLYRLNDISDIEYLGAQECFDGNSVVVVEWAERLAYRLPEEYLEIRIDIIDNNKRNFRFKAYGKRFDDIIRRYLKQQF